MSGSSIWNSPSTVALVRAALREDVGSGDVTTRALLDPRARGTAAIKVHQSGSVAGVPLVRAVYAVLDQRVRVGAVKREGACVEPCDLMCLLTGPRSSLLTGERTALNFVQRLSGIATLTARCVAAAGRYGVKILDTRKTTPGWRELEKYAVRCGGGANHRRGLYDAVLIKDNHLEALAEGGGVIPAARSLQRGEVAQVAVALARRAWGSRYPVELEVQSMAELEGALLSNVDIIMLDNLPPRLLRVAIRRIRAAAGARRKAGLPLLRIEISGGVRPESVAKVARFRPDFISMGALTHSAPAFDCSMEFGYDGMWPRR